jgi:hypothetical protein
MRALALACVLLATAGCHAPWFQPVGAIAGANVAAIPVVQRDLFDVAYSTITGKDCSVVRLDRGQSYCRAEEPPPAPPPYCTRSLGTVDCWRDPNAIRGPIPPEVADGPRTLTPAQERDRTRRWPDL